MPSSVEVVQRPSFILWAMMWLSALVVFACIRDKCYRDVCTSPWNIYPDAMAEGDCKAHKVYCVYNSGGACSFTVFVGVLAFIMSSAFMAAEFLRDQIGRATVSLMIGACSAVWSFFWLIAFCWVTHGWRKEPHDWPVRVVNNAQGALVFSLISLGLWVAGAYLSFVEVRDGQGYQVAGFGASAYTPYQASDITRVNVEGGQYSGANQEAYTPPSGAL